MNWNVQLTTQSAAEVNRLRSSQMTPSMAAEYLKEERIVLRTFAETLRDLYPGGDLYSRLVDAFLADDPERNPESVSRNVRNWLAGRNRPTSREDVFHIAFALSFSEEEAGCLLGLCTDYGIHYRNGQDVIYAWFLRFGRSYREAREFFASLPPIPPPDPDAKLDSHLTQELRSEFARVQSTEDLRACYLANLNNFGALHLRAYTYFRKYLDLLVRPSSVLDGSREPDYSMEAVMERYFSLRMPSGRNRRSYTVTQKLIKQNWPNTTALKNIRLRKEDVPRKLLLLLYVVTENVLDDAYNELDEEYITPQERLEDHWWCLNAILSDCGMPPLDPRNATDWLVLYAISAEDEPMSERMEQVIGYMFADVSQQEPQKEKPSAG